MKLFASYAKSIDCAGRSMDIADPQIAPNISVNLGGGIPEWVRASTGDRTVDGSSPTLVKTFLFGTLAIPFTPLRQCLSDETVKAVDQSLLSFFF